VRAEPYLDVHRLVPARRRHRTLDHLLVPNEPYIFRRLRDGGTTSRSPARMDEDLQQALYRRWFERARPRR
jgi:hypothetical protein